MQLSVNSCCSSFGIFILKLGVTELTKKYQMLSISSKAPLLTIQGSVEEIQKVFFPGNFYLEVDLPRTVIRDQSFISSRGVGDNFLRGLILGGRF